MNNQKAPQEILSVSSESEDMSETYSPPFDDSAIGLYFSSYNSLKDVHQTRERGLLAKIILSTIFQSENFEQEVQIIFSRLRNSSKPVCGKILTENDIGFKCLDCQKDPTCITCKECFDNANHQNHRIIVQKTVLGCCDCGDPDAWAEAGFCKFHPGYAKFETNVDVGDLPVEFRFVFDREITKAIYFFCLLLEKASVDGDRIADNPILPDILATIDFCGQHSTAIYSLVCFMLQRPFPSDCRLYHTCNDLHETE